MRRFSLLAVALCAIGCSSHSATPSPATISNEAAPQVAQGYGGSQWAYLSTHSYVGSSPLHWTGSGMSLLSSAGVLNIAEYGKVTLLPATWGSTLSDAIGPDGNLWVADSDRGAIRVITRTGQETSYPMLYPSTYPTAIMLGPDGALWFGESPYGQHQGIGRITTGGAITEFQPPEGNFPIDTIVSGSDGNLWAAYGHGGTGFIFRITTSGTFTQFPLPGRGIDGRIIEGPDGAVWFGGIDGQGDWYLGRVATDGSVTQHPLPTWAPYQYPSGLSSGGPNTLWGFFKYNAHGGAIASYNIATQQWSAPAQQANIRKVGGLYDLAVGPDGNVWGTDNADKTIAVYLVQAITVNPSPLTISGPGLQSNLTVTETNYTGNWSGSSNNKAVATVARGKTQGTLVVTAVGAGSCILTVVDTDHNTVKVKVTVQ